MLYQFDWNPEKEQQNIRKHGISFRQAATIFRDPNQLSIYDRFHSKYEDRWITIGLDKIRIISARKATNNETRQYQEDRG